MTNDPFNFDEDDEMEEEIDDSSASNSPSKCKICLSPFRDIIEKMIADETANYSAKDIIDYIFLNYGEKINRRSIYTHKNKHLVKVNKKTTNIAMIETGAEQAIIDQRFRDDDVDEYDETKTISYLISKLLKHIETIEKLNPSQIPHQVLLKYFGEVRSCISTLKSRSTAPDNNININIVNNEVVTILRIATEVVRELMPSKYMEFSELMKTRLQGTEQSIVCATNPTRFTVDGKVLPEDI